MLKISIVIPDILWARIDVLIIPRPERTEKTTNPNKTTPPIITIGIPYIDCGSKDSPFLSFIIAR